MSEIQKEFKILNINNTNQIHNKLLINSINIIKKCWYNYQRRYLLKIKWSKVPIFINNLTTKNKTIKQLQFSNILEKKFGNNINKSNTNQWATQLSENLFKQVMNKKGIKIWRPKIINNYKPDFESNEYIYEIKCRNWTTPGTAGEKVLGVPYKYSDIPRIYNKPLKIVCMAFQEYELLYSNHNIFGNNISNEKRNIIKFWKQMNIEYIQFTTFL